MPAARLRGGSQHACPGLRIVHCAKALGRAGLKSSLNSAGRLCAWRRVACVQRDESGFSHRCHQLVKPAPRGLVYPEGTRILKIIQREAVNAGGSLRTVPVWVLSDLPFHLRSGRDGGRKGLCAPQSYR